MSSVPAHFNYAHYSGIHSIGGAAVFAALYLPLFLWYISRLFKFRSRVFFTLSLFCAIRVTAFTIRAVLAGSESAGEDKGLLIGYIVLFSVGFSGVLYSAIELVFDRERLFDLPRPEWIPPRIVRLRFTIVHVGMTAAVALGIAASNMLYSSNPDTAKTGMTCRKASTYIFLVIAAILLLTALLSAKSEIEAGVLRRSGKFGYTHGSFVFVAIAVLLLIRMAFYSATVSHQNTQQNEHLWFPLVALPELLATALFALPGLIPPQSELKERQEAADRAAGKGQV